MSTLKDDATTASFITFNQIGIHSELEGVVLSSEGPKRFHAIVTAREPLASLAEKGLDGAVVARFSCRMAANVRQPARVMLRGNDA
jgi:hypothetical protein